MRSEKELRNRQRRARFEAFEERLALSAQPVSDFLASGQLDQRLEQHYGELTPLPITPTGDFSLERLDGDIEHHELEMLPLLNDAHGLTGLDNVRNAYGFSGSGQTVVIIDSGIAYDHYALGAGFGSGYRVVGGWDFAENDANPYDDGPSGFHGTHVAGIVGSSNSTYRGVASGVDLVALRVFDDNGSGYFSWTEQALQWVHQHRNDFASPITTVNLSLGATWNSDSPPSWAMLEDEFTQLKADGMFISVSAGNSFTSYNTAGLSYPAASPYVVPVSSVDNGGALSYFSQRNSRVIAAPGRSIISTIPDYVADSNGVPNDFASASGTSMAAPYVAGAAALVRQAMQFVGNTGITQDTIYNQLRNTADVIYDSATDANYFRLHVQRAIDALMPSDDYGSTAATAYSLGTINSTASFSGLIGRLDDADYFTFTAGQTGTVRFATTVADQLILNATQVGGGASFDNNTLSFQVVTGQTYTFSFATTGGVGHYQIAAELTPSIIDLGSVGQLTRNDENVPASGTTFQFTATRSGVVTAEAFFNHAAGNVGLELYNSSNTLVASSNGSNNTERVDFNVASGEQFYLRVTGANQDVDLRLTNLVAVNGANVTATGLAGDDVFEVAAGSIPRLVVNGVEYSWNGSIVSSIVCQGGGGTDSFTVTGSIADEAFVSRTGSVEFTSGACTFRGDEMETVRVVGGGGNDSAAFYDSSGNDYFGTDTSVGVFIGGGAVVRAEGFRQVTAYAVNGGMDVARFFGTPGNETFRSDPASSELRVGSIVRQAEGFEQVTAYGWGGEDTANLYDSRGNDYFGSDATVGVLVGGGALIRVEGFNQINAFAMNGGLDEARFFGTPGDDTFQADPMTCEMRVQGVVRQTQGFGQVTAYGWGGADTANFYDSTGNDYFGTDASVGVLVGAGAVIRAEGFQTVNAFASNGGIDEARFFGTPGSDTFRASASLSELTIGRISRTASGFQVVNAYFADGGNASASLTDTPADDIFEWSLSESSLRGNNYSITLHSAKSIDVAATSGGSNRAVIRNLLTSDLVVTSGQTATCLSSGRQCVVRNFQVVTAEADSGEQPLAELGAVDYIFEQLGTWR